MQSSISKRRILNMLWLVMIAGLIIILLFRLRNASGIIEEAVGNSRFLTVDGSYSLGWVYVWLWLRYFSEFAFTAVFFLTGTMLFLRKSDSSIADYLAITFVALGVGQVTGNLHFLTDPNLPNFVYRLVDVISVFSAVFLFYVMPDGRFVLRWTRPASIVWAMITVIWTFFPAFPFNPLNNVSFNQTRPLSIVILLIPISTGIYAQIQRWRRATNEEERQQIRWMLAGMLFMVIAGIVAYSFPRESNSRTLERAVRDWISVLLSVGFPICLTVAVTKHRLWELNNILSQALVWVVMTAIVVAVFVLIVGGVGTFINSPSNPVLSAGATALVAIFFQPARQRIQKVINRYLFGFRDDPMMVISRIGERNQTGYTPDRLMDEIIETIAQLLKLPYVNVDLLEGDKLRSAATFGQSVPDPLQMPLIYQNNLVGYLAVGARVPGESFNIADMRLLEAVSWQIAALGHILRLNADLQSSRERLVRVAEKERQRLQRDLHDGLGTELSAQMIKIGTARAQVHREPDRADELLMDVEQKLVDAVGEVRRLIHNLRPPVLDQLGLYRTLEILVEEQRKRDFTITLIVPEDTHRLPPAVEIAAYRIVQEAITNVIKHAKADYCNIELRLNDNLELRIRDSGIGIPETYEAGVGLGSMRERAEELGGSFQAVRGLEGGTQIFATLPVRNNLLSRREA